MEVRYYKDADGVSRVTEWIDALDDNRTAARIVVQIERMRQGNFGDSRPVGGGVSESRIHIGKGYRLYYSRQGNDIVLLLCGGEKKTQTQDIRKAKAYLENYKQEMKSR